AVSLPVALGMFLLAPQICLTLFGPGYEQSAIHLQFLLPYFVLTLLNSVATCTLIALGEERSFARYQMIGSTVLIAAVLLVTSAAGSPGAGVGISFGELVTLLLLLRLLKRKEAIDLRPTAVRFAGALACTGILVYLAGGLDPVLLVPIAIAGLTISILLTRALSIHDARLLLARFI
ncbi:MAG: polysaccharide biosynthesis C-terminal domain-containing protein, partial [Ignavibacteria bacterium]|nr:polysaccharide biosynthesis C-terminal domain-containing protein [Ignavibacteria bacterium]